MESKLGIFDTGAIREACWQTCDLDYSAFPTDLSVVPLYRHEETRDEFYELAATFGCFDLCEDKYLKKRITLVVPIVAAGTAYRKIKFD